MNEVLPLSSLYNVQLVDAVQKAYDSTSLGSACFHCA